MGSSEGASVAARKIRKVPGMPLRNSGKLEPAISSHRSRGMLSESSMPAMWIAKLFWAAPPLEVFAKGELRTVPAVTGQGLTRA